ncbi:MAG: nuclear transport factor 2 family protein [Myxococcales bacterium]|nr:nuclear transport factor 2 family protein [Myxococcales bacterium]
MISAIFGRASYSDAVRNLACLGLLWAIFLGAAPGSAQEPDPSSPEGALLAVEARRYKAMIEAEVTGLEKLLADDLRYTHANGSVETKYQLIASLEAGNLDYQAIGTRDVTVRIVGDVGVVTGVAELRLAVRGIRSWAHLLYTAVYVKRERGWQLWVYQSTRHPQQP